MTISDLDSRSGSCGQSTDAVVVGGRTDDPPRACRSADRCGPERIVAVVEKARGRGDSLLEELGIGLVPYETDTQRVTDSDRAKSLRCCTTAVRTRWFGPR